MENKENTPESKTHGKHHSQMKWVDCAKEWEQVQMEKVREFKEQIHSLQ